MEVRIIDMDHNSRGVAKVNGKVYFVENALENEVVQIEILKEKRNLVEAKSTNIIKSSDDRVEPKCKYYNLCGGCNLMHLDYEKQKQYKINKVKKIFKKFAELDINIDEFLETKPLYYRNKITLHVGDNIGLYENNTYNIIDMNSCIISSKKINELYNIIKQLELDNINNIIIRTNITEDEIMVIFDIKDKKTFNLNIDKIKNYTTSIYLKILNNYEKIYGNDYIVETLNNFKFLISPDSFFQVNTLGAEKLYSKVKYYLGENNKVLDLYCGTGTIGIFVSDVSKKVVGVEINKYAIEDANKNKKINNIKNIDFICGDSGLVLKKIKKDFDAVIVDPPRSGLDKNAINEIIKINPNKIIYVSCDPVTLSRDIKILSDKYELKHISLVDMFPNTEHVETICVLKKL